MESVRPVRRNPNPHVSVLLGVRHRRHSPAPSGQSVVDGKKFRTLRGPTIAADFKALVIDYIDQRYGSGAKPTAAE